MHDTDHSIGRRPVLKGAGMTLAGLGGLASPVAAGKGKRNLEESESTVEFSIFAGVDNSGDGDINDPAGDFFFPLYPAIAGSSKNLGPFAFDTTVPQVTSGGQAIHYILRFVQGALLVNKPKPYVLTHVGEGRYQSRGATINFEVAPEDDVPPLFQPLIGMIGGPGKYRVVAHDEVQLYEKGGYFDWSVTRAEFYRRGKGGIDHKISLLYVVWDEDGSDNDPSNDVDRGFPGNPFVTPPVKADLPGVVMTTANKLITNGKLNPGGK